MLTLKYQFVVPKMYLIPIADSQIGDKAFAEEPLRRYVTWIKENSAAVILIGDIFDTPKKGGKATDVWEIALSPTESMDRALDIFQPIAGNILAAQEGNHCERMYHEFGRTPTQEFIARLGLPESIIADKGLILHLEIGAVRYSTFSLHGWGGARTTGGQINKVEALADVVKDADVYLTGHEHTMFCTRWDSDLTKSGDTEPLRQLFVGVGGFCWYTKFQEGIARRMPNVGAPRIRFNGERRDVHVSI
jgi:hypothetical protein